MTKSEPKSAPRWIKALLIISLAFNLLVIGAIGSKLFFHRDGNHFAGKLGPLAHPAAMHRAGRKLINQLPREKRQKMIKLIKEYRASLQPQLAALAQSRRAFAELIQKKYSQEEFDAAINKMNDAQNGLQKKANDLTKSVLSNLTPKERALFAKILLSPPRKRWFGRPHHFRN